MSHTPTYYEKGQSKLTIATIFDKAGWVTLLDSRMFTTELLLPEKGKFTVFVSTLNRRDDAHVIFGTEIQQCNSKVSRTFVKQKRLPVGLQTEEKRV